MRKILMLFMCVLVCAHVCAQTIVRKASKKPQITFEVSEGDTIYNYSFVGHSETLGRVTALRFHGRNDLVSTLHYLASHRLKKGEVVQLDKTIDKNKVSFGLMPASPSSYGFTVECPNGTSAILSLHYIRRSLKQLGRHVPSNSQMTDDGYGY